LGISLKVSRISGTDIPDDHLFRITANLGLLIIESDGWFYNKIIEVLR